MHLIKRLTRTINLLYPDGKTVNRSMIRNKVEYPIMIALHKEIYKNVYCSKCGSGFIRMATNLLKYYNDHIDEFIDEEAE